MTSDFASYTNVGRSDAHDNSQTKTHEHTDALLNTQTRFTNTQQMQNIKTDKDKDKRTPKYHKRKTQKAKQKQTNKQMSAFLFLSLLHNANLRQLTSITND